MGKAKVTVLDQERSVGRNPSKSEYMRARLSLLNERDLHYKLDHQRSKRDAPSTKSKSVNNGNLLL